MRCFLKNVLPAVLLTCCVLSIAAVAQEKAGQADGDAVGGVVPSPDTPDLKKEKLPKANKPRPTHQQTRTIAIPLGEEKYKQEIHTFCIDPRGRLLCSCGGEQIVQPSVFAGLFGAKSKLVNTPTGIRVISPDGKLLDSWKVDFMPQSINVGPDGFVYCGGAGKIAKMTLDGEIVKVIDCPGHKDMPPLPEIPEKVTLTDEQKKERKEKAQKLQKQASDLGNQCNVMLQRLADEEEKKLKKEGKLVGVTRSKIYERVLNDAEYIKLQEEASEVYMQLHYAEMKPREAAIQQRMMAIYQRRVSGIAAGDKDVFICCSSPKGYGFQVWRCDKDLGNAKMVIPRLSGCCGQMDIQAHGDKLYVAENGRMKVVVYDRDGKRLTMWGGDGRDGTGLNFAPCCNPMNIRFDHEGNVLTSEASAGVVKRFTPDGKFLGRVGRVKVVPGCKHVAIAVADEGKKVYMLDITRRQIVLMEPVAQE